MPKTLIIDATQDQFFMSNLGGGFKNSDLTIMTVHDALIADPKNIDARVEKFRDYDDIFLFVDRDDIISQLSATEISENLLNDTSIMQLVFPDLLGNNTRYDIPLPVEWINHEDVHEAITDTGARLESATEHEITIPYQDSSSENPTLKRLTLRSANYFFQVNFHSSTSSTDPQTQNKGQKQSIPKYIGEKFLIPLIVTIIGGIFLLWFQYQQICCVGDIGSPTLSPPVSFEPTDTDDELLPTVVETTEIASVEITETLNPSPTMSLEPTVVVETRTPTLTPTLTLTPLPDSLVSIPAPDGCLTFSILLINVARVDFAQNCSVQNFIIDATHTAPTQTTSVLDANVECESRDGRLPTIHEWLWAVIGNSNVNLITLTGNQKNELWEGIITENMDVNIREWVWYVRPQEDPDGVGIGVSIQEESGQLVARRYEDPGFADNFSFRCYFEF